MPATESKDGLSENAIRAHLTYERYVRPNLRPEDHGKFVAMVIDSGEYEIDANDYSASGRLLERFPGARLWMFRAGHAAAYRIPRALGVR